MSLITNMGESDYEAYCDRIITDGYTTYQTNEINGNLFRTYYKDGGLMLHTYWTKHSQEVRTIEASTTLLPVKNATVEKECDVLFHQLKSLQQNSSGVLDGGMGYIIRLKDGRFLIVDGGHYTADEAEAIYTFLQQNVTDATNNKIVIATWYLTHAHNDHSGAFRKFVESYMQESTNIEIESIMFNACDTEEQMEYCTSDTAAIKSVIGTYCSDVPVYKPLTGQVYTFADTSIEILYTMSDFLPSTIAYENDGNGGDYNIQSMVGIIDIDCTADLNDRIFIMGDTTSTACDEMVKRYGTYMACDYVQVAHHGLNEITGAANYRRHGATQAIYECILKTDGSTIAMWPTSKAKYEERTDESIAVNYWLLNNASVKAHWIAETVSDNERTITFQ